MTNIIAAIAAVIILWLVFTWLVNVVKTSFATAVKVVLVLGVAWFCFAIAPLEIGQHIWQLPGQIWEFVTNRG